MRFCLKALHSLCITKVSGLLHFSRQKLNSLALSKHTQLLEILEIPQLMETCVRNGYYEEALELYAHVHKVGKKYGDIHILKVSWKSGIGFLHHLHNNYRPFVKKWKSQLK